MPIKTSNNTSITKIYGKTAGKHLSQSAIPPINFHSNTDNISYSIYGNLVQSETPSPTNPIIPVEVGEKTENLFDENATDTNNGYLSKRYLAYNGVVGNSSNHNVPSQVQCCNKSLHKP